MTTISLKVPAELDQRLRLVAARRGMTESAVLRQAADRYIEQAPEKPDSCLAMAGDLVGCVDGPEDLSYSKSHLQGFGE